MSADAFDKEDVALYIKFRGNPANDDFTDGQFAAQVGLDVRLVKKMGNDGEISSRVLEERRKRISKELIEVDKGLLKRAREGDTRAASLVYARFEGWTPKTEEAAQKTMKGGRTLAEMIAEHDG